MEILGIDIGGSGVKGAIVNIATGELITPRERIETPKPATPLALTETIKTLVSHFNWTGKVGCGFPAAIQHGVARTASNIDKQWIGTNAETLFSEATGCNVTVLNDADAAGLAEIYFGSPKGKEGLVFLITVGTGLGTALFQNGILIPNTELGHLLLENGKIAEHYAADSVRKREELSWDEWGKRFNIYLNQLYELFYPDMFIIGGGASKKFEHYAAQLDVEVTVAPAQNLNQAGIIGAAMAAYAHAQVAQ